MTETKKLKKIAIIPTTIEIAVVIDADLVGDQDALMKAAYEQHGKFPELDIPRVYDFDYDKVEFEDYKE